MDAYLPLLVMLVLAVLFAALSFGASKLLAPQRPTAAKLAPYECGIVPSREPPERFPVKFYLVAMLFIMFDIEIIFLYPWAVVNQRLGAFGLVAMLIFLGIFFFSFLYEIGKGGLEWGPAQRRHRTDPATDPARTSDSTVRRVGLEGRLTEDATAEDATAEEPTAEEVRA